MTILAEIFAAQSSAPDLRTVTASPQDVMAAAVMIGWLSDESDRWIPLAAVRRA